MVEYWAEQPKGFIPNGAAELNAIDTNSENNRRRSDMKRFKARSPVNKWNIQNAIDEEEH